MRTLLISLLLIAFQGCAYSSETTKATASDKSWFIIVGGIGNAVDGTSEPISIWVNNEFIIRGSFSQAANEVENFILNTRIVNSTIKVKITVDGLKKPSESQFYINSGHYLFIDKDSDNPEAVIFRQEKHFPRMEP